MGQIIVSQLIKKSLSLMKSESSLPCSTLEPILSQINPINILKLPPSNLASKSILCFHIKLSAYPAYQIKKFMVIFIVRPLQRIRQESDVFSNISIL